MVNLELLKVHDHQKASTPVDPIFSYVIYERPLTVKKVSTPLTQVNKNKGSKLLEIYLRGCRREISISQNMWTN